MRRRYLLLVLLFFGVFGRAETVTSCTDLPTIKQILTSDFDTSLAAGWALSFNSNVRLFRPDTNFTHFVPTNTALEAAAEQWSGITNVNVSNVGLGGLGIMAAYAILEGRYSPENLTAVPSVNSVLGMMQQEDFVVTVFRNGDGKLQVSGILDGDVANVLDVRAACNGYMYKLDRMLLPSKNSREIILQYNQTIARETYLKNNLSCPVPLPEVISGIPNTGQWSQVLSSSGLMTALNDTLLSATIFVPLDQAVQTADSAMYNMLRGAWCPNELLSMGSMNSMLGEYTERELPLRFTNESGTLVIMGEFGSAKVLNHSIGCESVIFITDVPLYLPRPAITAPLSLPTLPIRHITCNAPIVLSNNSSSPEASSSSGSKTGLAIGLGVGLGITALLAAMVVAVFIRRRRKRGVERLNTPQEEAEADSSLGSLPTAALDAEKNGDLGTENTANSFFTAASAPASTIFASGVSFPGIPTVSLSQSLLPPPASVTGSGTPSLPSSFGESSAKTSNGSSGTQPQITRLGARSTSTSLDLWELDPSDVEISVDTSTGQPIELGRGSFGSVYRGTLRGIQPAAIKVLNASVGIDAENAFQREAAILKHVNRDRNVVQLYGTSRMPDGKLLLVTELMEGGDLRRALNNPETKEALAWHRGGKRVALDIARGLTALHAVHVIHRDLKSKNVLLTETLTAKVADVGIAAVHSQGYLTASAGNVIGTLAWSAPELLLGKRCTEKVDIYSLGIVLWEIATGKVPQRGFTQAPPASERCPAELAALIKECTDSDARVRPTAKEVCERILIMPPLADA